MRKLTFLLPKVVIYSSQVAKFCFFLASLSLLKTFDNQEQEAYYDIITLLYISAVIEGSFANTMMRMYTRVNYSGSRLFVALSQSKWISFCWGFISIFVLYFRGNASHFEIAAFGCLVSFRVVQKACFGVNWSIRFNLVDRFVEAGGYFFISTLLIWLQPNLIGMIIYELLLIVFFIISFSQRTITVDRATQLSNNSLVPNKKKFLSQAMGSSLVNLALPVVLLIGSTFFYKVSSDYSIALRYSQALALGSLAFYQPYLQSALSRSINGWLDSAALTRLLLPFISYVILVLGCMFLIDLIDTNKAIESYISTDLVLIICFFCLMSLEKLGGFFLMLLQRKFNYVYWIFSTIYIIVFGLGYVLADSFVDTVLFTTTLMLITIVVMVRSLGGVSGVAGGRKKHD